MNFEDARWTAGGLRLWKDVSDGTLDACRGRHLHRMSRGDQFHRPGRRPGRPGFRRGRLAAVCAVSLVGCDNNRNRGNKAATHKDTKYDKELHTPKAAAAAFGILLIMVLVVLPREPARRELLVRGDLKPRAAREEVSINDLPTA